MLHVAFVRMAGVKNLFAVIAEQETEEDFKESCIGPDNGEVLFFLSFGNSGSTNADLTAGALSKLCKFDAFEEGFVDILTAVAEAAVKAARINQRPRS